MSVKNELSEAYHAHQVLLKNLNNINTYVNELLAKNKELEDKLQAAKDDEVMFHHYLYLKGWNNYGIEEGVITYINSRGITKSKECLYKHYQQSKTTDNGK